MPNCIGYPPQVWKKRCKKIAKKYFDNEAIIETSKKFPACEKIV